jgi:simple sugar transport system permease protein
LFAAWAGIHITFLPPWLHVPVAFIAAFVGGALWGAVPAILKLRYGVSVILSNLMLNPIAVFFMEYLLWGPMKDPTREHPMSVPIRTSAQFPLIFPATRVHLGIFLAFLAPLAVYFLLSKTTFGYKLRAVGDNPAASRVAGIKIDSILLRTILISSGLSGLAGALLVCGIQSRFIEGLSPGGGFSGYGFVGIGVAMLGCCHPLGIVLASILFGFLGVCGHLIHVQQGISQYLTDIISGLIILFVLYSNYFVWRWKQSD